MPLVLIQGFLFGKLDQFLQARYRHSGMDNKTDPGQ